MTRHDFQKLNRLATWADAIVAPLGFAASASVNGFTLCDGPQRVAAIVTIDAHVVWTENAEARRAAEALQHAINHATDEVCDDLTALVGTAETCSCGECKPLVVAEQPLDDACFYVRAFS